MAISVETQRIDSGGLWKKEFSNLIQINPLMVLNLTVSQADSCHGCVCGPLT